MKAPGHNFHPSRVPGKAKFNRMLDINREMEKKNKKYKKPILDLSKPNWSTKKDLLSDKL